MELFSVFAKIALNVQEFEEGLNNATKAMAQFVKAVNAKAEAISETMDNLSMAFDVEQFEKSLNRATYAMKEFARIVEEKAYAINEAMDGISIVFTTGYEQVSESATGIGETIMRIVGYITTLSGAKKAADAIFKVINYITNNIPALSATLATAGNWLKIFGVALAGVGLRMLGLSGVPMPAFIAALGNIGKAIGTVTAAVFSWKGVLVAIGAAFLVARVTIAILAVRFVHLALTCEETQIRIAKVMIKLREKINTAIYAIREYISSFIAEWRDAWDTAVNIVNKFVIELPKKLAELVYTGRNAITGFIKGIESTRALVRKTIDSFFRSNVVDVAKRVLGINSPSRVFADEVGKMIVRGVAEGIDEEAYLAKDSAIKMAQEMLEPQVEMFELSFIEIAEIVIRTLDDMSRRAVQVMRAMTATIDAILVSDGFRIGRNFFRALGDGLIAEEAALLSRASWVADAIRAEFDNPLGNPGRAAVRAAQNWGHHHPHLLDVDNMPMASPTVNVTQNFYGVREKETAYQAYRAAQRVAWGVER